MGAVSEDFAEPLDGRVWGGRQVPVAPQGLGNLVVGSVEQGERESARTDAPEGIVRFDVVGYREVLELIVGSPVDGLPDPFGCLRARLPAQPQGHHRLGTAGGPLRLFPVATRRRNETGGNAGGKARLSEDEVRAVASPGGADRGDRAHAG
jgi:hypothetical protein